MIELFFEQAACSLINNNVEGLAWQEPLHSVLQLDKPTAYLHNRNLFIQFCSWINQLLSSYQEPLHTRFSRVPPLTNLHFHL